MDYAQYIMYAKYLGWVIGAVVVMYGFNKYMYVKRTIGWNFVDSIAKVKFSLKEFDLVLRIVHPSGAEEYQFVKQTKIISYKIKIRGEEVIKAVIFDARAVNRINGVPILSVSPNDIRPIDRETGLNVDIPGEVVLKLIADATKTAEDQAKRDKLVTMVLWGAGIGIVLFILGMAYINQTNAELQVKLMECTINLGKSAVVVGK